MKKIISIAASCYNEAGNIRAFYERCRNAVLQFPELDYEFVIADNFSTDGTRELLRQIAAEDPKFRVILNAGNFGHIRSPYNAFLQAKGDAVVTLCSDLQEPPELIVDFIRKWQEGFRIVAGVRKSTHGNLLMECFRGLYYRLLEKISPEQKLICKFTGFGLYDRSVVEVLRTFDSPYPYFRGMVSETGFPHAEILFEQQKRTSGRTKNNLFTLYDIGMTGLVNHSKLPLRLAVFSGFVLGICSFLIALAYLIMKLIYWDTFSFGMAPLMIGLFFFGSIQLFFIGILGEYIGAIWTQVRRRPLVVEQERINFDK